MHSTCNGKSPPSKPHFKRTYINKKPLKISYEGQRFTPRVILHSSRNVRMFCKCFQSEPTPNIIKTFIAPSSRKATVSAKRPCYCFIKIVLATTGFSGLYYSCRKLFFKFPQSSEVIWIVAAILFWIECYFHMKVLYTVSRPPPFIFVCLVYQLNTIIPYNYKVCTKSFSWQTYCRITRSLMHHVTPAAKNCLHLVTPLSSQFCWFDILTSLEFLYVWELFGPS